MAGIRSRVTVGMFTDPENGLGEVTSLRIALLESQGIDVSPIVSRDHPNRESRDSEATEL